MSEVSIARFNQNFSGRTKDQTDSLIPELNAENVNREIDRIIQETDGLSADDRTNLFFAFSDVAGDSDDWVATLKQTADDFVKSGKSKNVSDPEVQGLIDDINKVGTPEPQTEEEAAEGGFDFSRINTNITTGRTDETQEALDKIATESQEQKDARESIADGVDTEDAETTTSPSDFSNEEYVNEINSLSALFFDNQPTYNGQPVSRVDIQSIFADNFEQGASWRNQLYNAFAQYQKNLDAAGTEVGETEADRLARESQENKDRADTVEIVRELTDDVIDSDNTPVEFTQEEVTGLLDELINADPVLMNLVDNNTIPRSKIINNFNDRIRLGCNVKKCSK